MIAKALPHYELGAVLQINQGINQRFYTVKAVSFIDTAQDLVFVYLIDRGDLSFWINEHDLERRVVQRVKR